MLFLFFFLLSVPGMLRRMLVSLPGYLRPKPKIVYTLIAEFNAGGVLREFFMTRSVNSDFLHR